jgi:hypothetical protein
MDGLTVTGLIWLGLYIFLYKLWDCISTGAGIFLCLLAPFVAVTSVQLVATVATWGPAGLVYLFQQEPVLPMVQPQSNDRPKLG